MELPEFHTQHVLIIDENERNQKLFLELIDELPYLVHVSLTSSGNEGIRKLKELDELPDLIFLDIEMTLKDGLTCLHEIKADTRFESIPVIVFSTSSFPAVVSQAYEWGAHLYILKSEALITLKNSVQHLLSINWKEKISRPPREEFVLSFGEQ